jgi:multidrug efflux pump subunit AcrB
VLRPEGAHRWLGRQLERFEVWVDEATDRYHDLLAWALDRPRLIAGVAAVVTVLAVAGWSGAGGDRLLRFGGGWDGPTNSARLIELEVIGGDGSTLAGVGWRVADEVRLVPGVVDVTVSTGLEGSRVGAEGVTVDVEVESGVARRVLSRIDARLARVPLPPGYRIARHGRAAEALAAVERLLLGLVVAVVLTYLTVAGQLGSGFAPLGLVLVLPVAAVGAAGGIVVAGGGLSVAGLIGVLLTAGIALRQAALLVTCASRRRGRGVTLRVALIEAGRVRFRPVALTNVTLVVASLPVAVAGSGFLAAFGVAVIGGALTTAVGTLLITPVLHEILAQPALHLGEGLPSSTYVTES